MKMKNEIVTADVGVIVGRFQVHALHKAHVDLIETVCSKHEKVILFLGLSPLKSTKNNPLDYESRKRMIEAMFPQIIIAYIKDCKSDKLWSTRLDNQIKDMIGANHSVVLYGSRDSFISHYKGDYETIELMPELIVSGNELRKSISRTVMNTSDFRAGAIWSTQQGWPSCVPTVDIAIYDRTNKRFLMARKPDEKEFRFIGGFGESKSDSFELDAKREVREEAGIETGDMNYIGSYKINDWRYRSEESKIKTIFFFTEYIFGCPIAGDDIAEGEVRWFKLEDMNKDNIVDTHHVLLEALQKYMEKQVAK